MSDILGRSNGPRSLPVSSKKPRTLSGTGLNAVTVYLSIATMALAFLMRGSTVSVRRKK